MRTYLNTPIKEVIEKFSEVGRTLEEYNIGCVSCNPGPCLLKDIVAIHKLPANEEAQLMHLIEAAIYPDRDIKKPEGKASSCKTYNKTMYSPPIKRLVDEHFLIKKWLELIPDVIEIIDIESGVSRQLILDGLDFIRFYADKYHHAKEEDILFGYTDKNLDIIKTILQEHETARSHARTISEAIKSMDGTSVAQHLGAYGALLTEHIKKEEEVLYPWIDRSLSTRQVGELFARFDVAEARMDKKMMDRCEQFALEAEKRVQNIKIKKEEVK